MRKKNEKKRQTSSQIHHNYYITFTYILFKMIYDIPKKERK